MLRYIHYTFFSDEEKKNLLVFYLFDVGNNTLYNKGYHQTLERS
ncbi:hypothetical protein D920_02419 [Enterococcus faecalis 13-SD-W-01]|nr:hypothetical protein D920_02419 [Enterococcus faecalis 13-SD-W-01]